MSRQAIHRPLLLLIPLALLAACTATRGPVLVTPPQPPVRITPSDVPPLTGIEVAPPIETPVAPPPPARGNAAVVALLDRAHVDAGAGRWPAATASIERALRIEPRNPVLWQELALLKLQKGEYQQAENFAARSNSWAGTNKPLLAKNWRIISDARSLRGDGQGAQAALARAKGFEASTGH